MKNYTNLT